MTAARYAAFLDAFSHVLERGVEALGAGPITAETPEEMLSLQPAMNRFFAACHAIDRKLRLAVEATAAGTTAKG